VEVLVLDLLVLVILMLNLVVLVVDRAENNQLLDLEIHHQHHHHKEIMVGE
jgi:hypothetical protein